MTRPYRHPRMDCPPELIGIAAAPPWPRCEKHDKPMGFRKLPSGTVYYCHDCLEQPV